MSESTNQLYKMLYNAARSATAPYWQSDPERIKDVRDQACTELFGKKYTELNDYELNRVIDELNSRSSNSEFAKKPRASFRQVKLVKFYGLICAINYFDYKNVVHYDKASGQELTGESLKQFIKDEFEKKHGLLPLSIYRWLFASWINPHSHKFLIEGEFKKYTKEPNRFFYEYLEPVECQYLANRFREIATNLQTKVTLDDFLKQVTKN